MPSLIMVANPTIQYMLYEWGAQWWRRPSKGVKTSAGANLTSIEVFLISAVAKLGATLLTYPLLVVKNRVQVCHPCCCIGLVSSIVVAVGQLNITSR